MLSVPKTAFCLIQTRKRNKTFRIGQITAAVILPNAQSSSKQGRTADSITELTENAKIFHYSRTVSPPFAFQGFSETFPETILP